MDQRDALEEHLIVAHSNVTDLPMVAKAAGAAKLVLSHYTPLPEPPAVFRAKAQAAADAVGYTGEIIAPSDLDTITI